MGALEIIEGSPLLRGVVQSGLLIEGLDNNSKDYTELSLVVGNFVIGGSTEQHVVAADLVEPTLDELVELEQGGLTSPESQTDLDIGWEDPVRQYLNRIGSINLLKGEREEASLAKQIEVGVLAKERYDQLTAGYNLDAVDHQMLDDLLLLYKEGMRAKERFISANLRWVVTIAKRSIAPSMPLLDCIQLGNEGLIRAVEKFDYTKGIKFSTYSAWWIRQSIQYGVRREGRAIRLPKGVSLAVGRFSRVKEQFVAAYEREPTIAEIAAVMDLPAEEVRQLNGYARRPVSLDRPVDQRGGAVIGDLIEDTETTGQIEQVLDWQEAAEVERLIDEAITSVQDKLPKGQRGADIVRLFFGLGRREKLTAVQIAEHYHISETQVKVTMRKARALLKPALQEKGLGW